MFPWAITFSSGLLVHAASHAAKKASVPVSIHLDHAQDEYLIKLAADTLPFDSIMVDMSHYERDENLAKTKALVAYCHERGIATEAEPGRIEGGEDGIADTADLEGVKTTKEDVEDFANTGVDFLAPAFGNVHGEYGPKGPDLDFERYISRQPHTSLSLVLNPGKRLDSIRIAINGRLRIAMHGTNGFSENTMKECIKHGVSKVNVNKLVLDDYITYVEENASKVSITKLMEEGVKKAQGLTEWQMDVCGSTGKAK
jgi:fructose-bisphosphate aldolase class II